MRYVTGSDDYMILIKKPADDAVVKTEARIVPLALPRLRIIPSGRELPTGHRHAVKMPLLMCAGDMIRRIALRVDVRRVRLRRMNVRVSPVRGVCVVGMRMQSKQISSMQRRAQVQNQNQVGEQNPRK